MGCDVDKKSGYTTLCCLPSGRPLVADALPVDYLILDTDEEVRNGLPMSWKGYTPAHHTNEYWLLNNGGFILGVLYLTMR